MFYFLKKIFLIISLILLSSSDYITKKTFELYNNEYDLSVYILKIPKISMQYIINPKLDLSEGLEVMGTIKKDSLLIMGHSGYGNNSLFNDLEYLNINDEIYIYYKDDIYKYVIFDISYFSKGTSLNIKSTNDYLYLVTCDLKNSNMQYIISSKLL